MRLMAVLMELPMAASFGLVGRPLNSSNQAGPRLSMFTMCKRALTICSTAFKGLGHGQARALGLPQLPIALVPHPFGIRARDEIKQIAADCVDEVARLLCMAPAAVESAKAAGGARAASLEVSDDLDVFNRLLLERHWSDGLPAMPPTRERVKAMLQHTSRKPDDIVGAVAPAFGVATVERIAINAVMAGCYPEY